MGTINFHSVVVFVKDIQRMKGFYQDLFNLKISYDFGSNMMFDNGFSLWSVGSDHHMFSKISKPDESQRAFELYFETDHIDEIKEMLQNHELPLVHQLMEEPWGQYTVRFHDPEMNLVEVAESLKGFVMRMKTSGMTNKEISSKTGIPDLQLNHILSS